MFYVPQLLASFIFGFICALLATYLKNVIKTAILINIDDFRPLRYLAEVLKIYDTEILEAPSVSVYGELTVHEEWMVVYYEHYNSESFDIADAQPAYVSLNGSNLRISYTKEKVLRKAVWDEQPYKHKFYHHDDFDISNCDVKLLPPDLSRARRWLRKYPIYIALSDPTLGPIGQSVVFSSMLNHPIESVSHELQTEIESDNASLNRKEIPTVETPLYLFGRTNRQKEDWYRRLVAATKLQPKHRDDTSNQTNLKNTHKRVYTVRHSKTMKRKKTFIKYLHPMSLEPDPSDYLTLMSDYNLQVITNTGVCILKPYIDVFKPATKDKIEIEIENARKMRISPNLLWFNAFMARIVSDLTKNPNIRAHLHRIAQKKVSSIGLPSFIEDLTVTDIQFGDTVPKIHCTSNPMLDQRGIWVNVDITYTGCVYLVIETKLNLMKKHYSSQEEDIEEPIVKTKKPTFFKGSAIAPNINLDNRSSDASTANAYKYEEAGNSSGKKRKKVKNKFLRCMNTIIRSKAFQCATRHSCLRSTLEEWSNQKLTLNAQLKGFAGTLTLNIPPPPADRIWYGFYNVPYLNIQAIPAMDSKPLERLKTFVRNGLIKLVRKRIVLPNMQAIIIPAMNGSLPK